MFIQNALVASADKGGAPSPSINYDITNLDTTATSNKGQVNFNTIGQTNNNNATGSYLSHDGTYLFVADINANCIYRYTLNTAFDIGTATLTGTSPSISSSTYGRLGAIYFKSDGSLLFVASYNYTEAQNTPNSPIPRIIKFTLNTNWDITNLTNEITTIVSADFYLFGAISTIAFTPTGDKLFIGTGHSGYMMHVAQFPLSTNFDIGPTSMGTSTPIKDLGFNTIPDGMSVQGFYRDSLGNPLSNPPGATTDCQFSSNGLRAWFLTSSEQTIYEFNTSTAYSLPDLTSPSGGTEKFDFRSQDTGARGFAWGDSGTKLYMVGIANDSLYQYTASTAYTLAGLSYANKSINLATLTGETSFNGYAIRWKPDGTRFYIIEGGLERVYQFDIPAANAWDITYATFTTGDYKAVSPPISFASYALDFDPNGNFFIAGGYSSYQINKWTMTAAWDVTTAGSYSTTDRLNFLDVVKCWDYTAQYLYGAQFLDNGSKLLVHISTGGASVLTLGTAYALNTASWSQPSQNYFAARTITGLNSRNMGNFAFSESGANAGKKLVTLNSANLRAYTITFNTAWDIASATSGTSDILMQGAFGGKFITASTGSTNNGLYYYLSDTTNNTVFQYEFSSAWSGAPLNFSTVRPSTNWLRSSESYSHDDQTFVFENGGLYMFTVDDFDGVSRYDLSSAYNISNPTLDARVSPFGSQDTRPWTVRFKPDGLTMYMLGRQNDTIYTYTLSSAWDLSSTITYQSSKDLYIGGTDSDPYDMVFSTDGDYFFIIGNQRDTIYRYSLTADWDLSTASLDSGQVLDTLENYGYCICFSPDGRKVLAGGGNYISANQQYLKQWTLSTPWDISTSSRTFDLERQDTMFPPRSLNWNATGNRLFVGSYGTTNITKLEVWEYNASG